MHQVPGFQESSLCWAQDMAREVRLIFISSADSGKSAGTLSKAI